MNTKIVPNRIFGWKWRDFIQLLNLMSFEFLEPLVIQVVMPYCSVAHRLPEQMCYNTALHNNLLTTNYERFRRNYSIYKRFQTEVGTFFSKWRVQLVQDDL